MGGDVDDVIAFYDEVLAFNDSETGVGFGVGADERDKYTVGDFESHLV